MPNAHFLGYNAHTSLVNKKSICGHHSVWELSENSWAAGYTYGKGTLPELDAFVERTVLFCIASRLSEQQKSVIRNAFENSCKQLNIN